MAYRDAVAELDAQVASLQQRERTILEELDSKDDIVLQQDSELVELSNAVSRQQQELAFIKAGVSSRLCLCCSPWLSVSCTWGRLLCAGPCACFQAWMERQPWFFEE